MIIRLGRQINQRASSGNKEFHGRLLKGETKFYKSRGALNKCLNRINLTHHDILARRRSKQREEKYQTLRQKHAWCVGDQSELPVAELA